MPLDNIGAERAMREVVVDRKNHYGSKSKAGSQVPAISCTLFDTAKLSGVDTRSFVLAAAKNAIRSLGAVTLPQNLL